MSAPTCQLRADPAPEVWWPSGESEQARWARSPRPVQPRSREDAGFYLSRGPGFAKWRSLNLFVLGALTSSVETETARHPGNLLPPLERRVVRRRYRPGRDQGRWVRQTLRSTLAPRQRVCPAPGRLSLCPARQGITRVPRATGFVSNTEQIRHLCEVSQENSETHRSVLTRSKQWVPGRAQRVQGPPDFVAPAPLIVPQTCVQTHTHTTYTQTLTKVRTHTNIAHTYLHNTHEHIYSQTQHTSTYIHKHEHETHTALTHIYSQMCKHTYNTHTHITHTENPHTLTYTQRDIHNTHIHTHTHTHTTHTIPTTHSQIWHTHKHKYTSHTDSPHTLWLTAPLPPGQKEWPCPVSPGVAGTREFFVSPFRAATLQAEWRR